MTGAGRAPSPNPVAAAPNPAAVTPPAATGAVSRPTSIAVRRGENGGLLLEARGGGRSVTVGQGDFLGEGSFSKAFSAPGTRATNAADDLGNAIKLTEADNGAAALDALGRNAVEAVGDANLIRTPRVIAQYDITSSVLVPSNRARLGPKDFTGGTATVLERTPPAFKDLPASAKLPDGSMTPGQAIAFNRGMEALNRRGFAWLDNKHDNFTFLPAASGNGTQYPKIGTLAAETTAEGLRAAEAALRSNHPLPPPAPAALPRANGGTVRFGEAITIPEAPPAATGATLPHDGAITLPEAPSAG